MEVYFFVFLISAIPFILSYRAVILNRKRQILKTNTYLVRTLFWWLAFIPLWLLSGLRYYNGADYAQYVQAFYKVNANIPIRFEFGYVWLCKLIGMLGGNATTSFVVTSFIIVFFYLRGISDFSDNKLLSFWLFLFTATYIDSFNGIRQYIAAAIFFFSIKFIYDGRWKWYLCFMLLAVLFHESALLLLPLYFLRYVRFTRYKSFLLYVALLASGNLLYQLLIMIVPYTPYAYYAEAGALDVQATQSSLVYVSAITAMAALLYRKHSSKRYQLLFNLQTVTMVVVLMSLVLPFSRRLQMYFLPLEIYCIPCFLKEIKIKWLRTGACFTILAMYAAIILYAVYVKGYYTAVPYRCVLFY